MLVYGSLPVVLMVYVDVGDCEAWLCVWLWVMSCCADGVCGYRAQGQKVHFLGLADGPNELMYMNPFEEYIDTWDSSSAVWAGLNGIAYDKSPTGLLDGKFELEVDFDFETTDNEKIELAKSNMEWIDVS